MMENRNLEVQKTKQLKKQKGASMMEYALLIAGVAIIAALLFSGDNGGVVGEAITGKVESAVNSVNNP